MEKNKELIVKEYKRSSISILFNLAESFMIRSNICGYAHSVFKEDRNYTVADIQALLADVVLSRALLPTLSQTLDQLSDELLKELSVDSLKKASGDKGRPEY